MKRDGVFNLIYFVAVTATRILFFALSVFMSLLVAIGDQVDATSGTVELRIAALLAIILLLLTLSGVFIQNLRFVKKLNSKLEKIWDSKLTPLRIGYPAIPSSLKPNLTETQYNGIILNFYYGIIVIGTITGAILWYVFPENVRLEPITVILGFFATALGYLRLRYSVTSPLNNVFTQPEKDSKNEPQSNPESIG